MNLSLRARSFRFPTRPFSFRTRLTLTITGVFMVAGVALLTVVYLLVSGLFNNALGASVTATGATQPAALVSDDYSVPSYSVVSGNAGMASPVAELVPADSAAFAQYGQPADFLGAQGIVAVNGQLTSSRLMTRATTSDVAMGPGGTVVISEASPAAQAITTWYRTKSETVAGDVLTGLLVWSGVALVVFAVLAAWAAWWLARRSLRRIGEVTKMAQDLSTNDLHRRLDLPGPADEIKDLADTIDEMLNRLETAFASQDRFVANASHELRTPMTTSRTALEIPLAQGRVPADLEPAIRTALKAGERTELLLGSLLTLARGGQTDIESEVDLAEVVSNEIEAAAEVSADAKISMYVDRVALEEVAAVLGDPTMIEQAVANLIDNALRHNHTGGSVQVGLDREGEEFRLRVENTGAVIDPADVALLTEPFYRAGSTRTATRSEPGRGVGLGLSIIARIAETHGGRVDLEARDGGGLVAILTLPAAPVLVGV
ncbi:sensor histidine kinase [Nakamurella silvestris]|nr:sensor histidine kinase [Nakamurella silvestris]